VKERASSIKENIDEAKERLLQHKQGSCVLVLSKGNLREKKETKRYSKTRTTDTEETKNHRERRKKGREKSKITIERVQCTGYSRRRNRFGERTKKKADGQRKWDPQKATKGTQERRYEGEDTSKKDNENGKSEGIILEKRTKEEFWDYVKQFERVGLVETWVKEWSWGKNSKKVVT
jgi:hypothetical protein